MVFSEPGSYGLAKQISVTMRETALACTATNPEDCHNASNVSREHLPISIQAMDGVKVQSVQTERAVLTAYCLKTYKTGIDDIFL